MLVDAAKKWISVVSQRQPVASVQKTTVASTSARTHHAAEKPHRSVGKTNLYPSFQVFLVFLFPVLGSDLAKITVGLSFQDNWEYSQPKRSAPGEHCFGQQCLDLHLEPHNSSAVIRSTWEQRADDQLGSTL